jgi:hypothetical protein
MPTKQTKESLLRLANIPDSIKNISKYISFPVLTMSTLCPVTHSLYPEGPLKGLFPLTFLSCISFSPPGQAVACPFSPIGSWASPNPDPILH